MDFEVIEAGLRDWRLWRASVEAADAVGGLVDAIEAAGGINRAVVGP